MKSSKFFKFVIDLDLASLYPSIIKTFNIDPATQLGKIIFYRGSEEHPEDQDPLKSKDFVVKFISDHKNSLYEEFFNLPSLNDIISELESEKRNDNNRR